MDGGASAPLRQRPISPPGGGRTENEAKGDDDASEWLPDRRFAWAYVATQIIIKTEYRLWVTRAEHDAMVATLDDCGGGPEAPRLRSRMVP